MIEESNPLLLELWLADGVRQAELLANGVDLTRYPVKHGPSLIDGRTRWILTRMQAVVLRANGVRWR